jgi:hypothetical protein
MGAVGGEDLKQTTELVFHSCRARPSELVLAPASLAAAAACVSLYSCLIPNLGKLFLTFLLPFSEWY